MPFNFGNENYVWYIRKLLTWSPQGAASLTFFYKIHSCTGCQCLLRKISMYLILAPNLEEHGQLTNQNSLLVQRQNDNIAPWFIQNTRYFAYSDALKNSFFLRYNISLGTMTTQVHPALKFLHCMQVNLVAVLCTFSTCPI